MSTVRNISGVLQELASGRMIPPADPANPSSHDATGVDVTVPHNAALVAGGLIAVVTATSPVSAGPQDVDLHARLDNPQAGQGLVWDADLKQFVNSPGGGDAKTNVRVITTAAVTAVDGDFLEMNATAQAQTVTLPSPSTAGRRVTVKKIDASANTVTVTGTIDGTVNPVLRSRYVSIELVSDGTSWVRAVRPTLSGLADVDLSSMADGDTKTLQLTKANGKVTATPVSVGSASALTPTSVKTAAYTAAVGELVLVDTTGGSVIITAPPAGPGEFAVKHVIQGSANGAPNDVVVAAAGSDVFNRPGGPTTIKLSLADMAKRFVGKTGQWTAAAGDLTLGSLDVRDDSPRLVDALNVLASTDRARSLATHRRDYDDTAAGVFNEQFADLAAWTQNITGGLVVSGGRVYNGGQTGFAGMRRPFAAASGSRFRVVTNINHAYLSGGAGSVLVGVTTTNTVSGAANWTGLGFGVDGTVYKFYGGTNQGAIITPKITAGGAFQVTIVGDENYVIFTLTNAARTVRRTFARTWAQIGGAITNIVGYNDDARGTSGSSLGPLGARPGAATIVPRTGVEGVTHTAVGVTIDATGDFISYELPASYDSRIPSPLLIWSHGHGGSEQETNPETYAPPSALLKALLDAGFIVACSNAGGNLWGNDVARARTLALYRYMRDHYAIGPVILAGTSMGGLNSARLLADKTIPGVAGMMIFQPVLSLAGLLANLQANESTNGASFKAAYGIAADYSDYTAKTRSAA